MGNKKSDHRPPSLLHLTNSKRKLFLLGSLCGLLEVFGCGRTWSPRFSHCFARASRNACFLGVDVGIKPIRVFHNIKNYRLPRLEFVPRHKRRIR